MNRESYNMKAKFDKKIALIGAGIVALVAMAKKKPIPKEEVEGVGAVLWEYAIMELRNAGVRLNQNYFALTWDERDKLRDVMKKFGYRQSASSAAMGRTPLQSFYYAIQRKL